MTWIYPFSPLSINKSYDYQQKKVLHNGKTYNEIVNDFKESYENDLNADSVKDTTNLTIDRTQYILPMFEQEWLISKDAVSIDSLKLDTILSEVKSAREVMFSLLEQVDYSSEHRGYLIKIIKSLLLLEESIVDLKDEKFATRSELNRRLKNLSNDFSFNFSLYTSFYERSFE